MANSGFNLPNGLKAGPVTVDAGSGAITTSGNVRVTGSGKFVGTNAPGSAPSYANSYTLSGTVNGVNVTGWKLIGKIAGTVSGSTRYYYYVDRSGNGVPGAHGSGSASGDGQTWSGWAALFGSPASLTTATAVLPLQGGGTLTVSALTTTDYTAVRTAAGNTTPTSWAASEYWTNISGQAYDIRNAGVYSYNPVSVMYFALRATAASS